MWDLSGECRMEPMLNSKDFLIARNIFNLSHLWKYWKCNYDSLPPLEAGERSWWHCTCLPQLTSICLFICWFWPVWFCPHLQAETDWRCYPFMEPLFIWLLLFQSRKSDLPINLENDLMVLCCFYSYASISVQNKLILWSFLHRESNQCTRVFQQSLSRLYVLKFLLWVVPMSVCSR